MTMRVRAGTSRAFQDREAPPNSLEDTIFERFLEQLAATCNVAASARAVGACPGTFYRRRALDEGFAAAWRAAILAGYERLEEALLARALGDVQPTPFDPGAVAIELTDQSAEQIPGGEELAPTHLAGLDDKVAVVDVQLALKLLNRRRETERLGRQRNGRRRASIAEVDKALGEKLDALARRLSEQAS